MQDSLITVAIHTLRYACSLKSILEKEGVKVTLQNVNLTNPEVAAGVRVRINERDLPVALRIIENPDVFTRPEDLAVDDQTFILVPTDFSKHSVKACDIAFRLAHSQGSGIRLLHSFLDPIYSRRSQLNDNLTFDDDKAHDEATSAETAQAEQCMQKLESSIVNNIKDGKLPAVKFSHEILEGIPEDSINQYARAHHPLLIVMGTRNVDDKARDLVGSVAAEVLDTCRYPVLTVPERCGITASGDLSGIMFFSNFDQQDILAIDNMFRLLPAQAFNICLVKLPSKKFSGNVESSLNRLKEYCTKHYPIHNFSVDAMEIDSVEDDFRRILEEHSIDLIAVPNKKKNMFARFFNPGVAHRLLFQTDMPMLVIPI